MLYYPILGSYCGLTIKSNCQIVIPTCMNAPFKVRHKLVPIFLKDMDIFKSSSENFYFACFHFTTDAIQTASAKACSQGAQMSQVDSAFTIEFNLTLIENRLDFNKSYQSRPL